MGPQTTRAGVEFTHLVHAVKGVARKRAFPLVVFAFLGTLLFAARYSFRDHAPSVTASETLVVRVDAKATDAEVEQQLDEAVLLSFAIRSGFVHNDAAVRDRLVRNVQFADDALNDRSALEEAIRLDMHRTDPVTRGRLIWLATEALAQATDSADPPRDEQLEAYLDAHESRFARAPTLSFEQIFVSRQQDAEEFERRVQRVAREPRASVSDPSLLPGRMVAASPTRIDARFGEGFAERLLALDDEASKTGWSAPISSAFGAHFVRVTERTPSQSPRLEEVRERVRHDFLADTRGARVQDALSRLRQAYRFRARIGIKGGS